jgi:hypothetical protein
MTPPLLDEDHAAFIESAVSIIAASSDAVKVPSLERAIGCKVSADRRNVTIFMVVSSARRLLDDVGSSGRIAVVFSEPPSHRTIQLKGTDAAIVPVVPADRKLVEAYADAMVGVIGCMGYPEPLTRAMLACPADELVAVSFTPTAAFLQTPGPRAGTPLKG